MAGSIFSLPIEIIVSAFHQADVPTILRSRQACKRLLKIIDSSMRLQYNIAIFRAGMLENLDAFGIDDLSLVERLDKLKRLSEQRNLAPTFSLKKKMVLDGLLDSKREDTILLVVDDDSREIRIPVPENMYVHRFECSTTLGLVACTMFQHEVREISVSVWDAKSSSWISSPVILESCRHIPHLSFEETNLMVSWGEWESWNVTSLDLDTGKYNHHRMRVFPGFMLESPRCVFLSPKLVLRGDQGSRSISIFKLEVDEHGTKEDTVHPLRLVVRLMPPRLKANMQYYKIFVDLFSKYGRHPKNIFYDDPNGKIAVVKLSIMENMMRVCHGALAIRTSTFYETLHAYSPCSIHQGVSDVPWESWGPGNTRFFPLSECEEVLPLSNSQSFFVDVMARMRKGESEDRGKHFDFNLGNPMRSSTRLTFTDWINPKSIIYRYFESELGEQLPCNVMSM